MDIADAGRYVADEVRMKLDVARRAEGAAVRPGGTLLFMGGTGGRRPAVGISVTALLTVGFAASRRTSRWSSLRSASISSPPGSWTPLSASLLGGDLEKRREHLRTTLPIRRVVRPDVAALAVHVMVNTALTGATFDIDGGQQIT